MIFFYIAGGIALALVAAFLLIAWSTERWNQGK